WLEWDRGAGDLQLGRVRRLVADLERRIARLFLGGSNRTRDVAGVVAPVETEHFLCPGLPRPRRSGLGIFFSQNDLGLIGHALTRSNLQSAPVSGLHPLSQSIAAVKDQARHFEREQANRGKQHDRNKPNVARKTGHAAWSLNRVRARSANACAAAATALASCKAGDSPAGRVTPAMRTNRANNCLTALH